MGKAGLDLGLPGLSQGNFQRALGPSAIQGMLWCEGGAPVSVSILLGFYDSVSETAMGYLHRPSNHR